MQIKLETRILDINIEKIKQKLDNLGTRYIGSYLMRRYVYEFSPKRAGSRIRLRDNGKNSTLAIKEIKNDKIDGTQEIEIIVDDFDKTNIILQKMGYIHRSYQENKRTSYRYNELYIEIDERPMITPYLEIEGIDKASIFDFVAKLGYNMSNITSKNVDQIYKDHNIDLGAISNLTF